MIKKINSFEIRVGGSSRETLNCQKDEQLGPRAN